MRLTADEIVATKAAARLACGDDVVVRLFGSRVDDARRGGDIDPHMEVGGPIDRWRAAGLGNLPDEKTWADAVRARNALAHEYPMNPARHPEQLNTARAAASTLVTNWAAIQRFVTEEGLLP